LLLVGTNC